MQVRSELWKRCLVLLLAGIFSISMLAGCSSGENPDAADSGAEVESSAESADNAADSEAADSSESEDAEVVAIEPIDSDELQSIIDKAQPYEGEVQMSVQAVSGEEVPEGEEPDSDVTINKNSYTPSFIRVSDAAATTTLQASGYNYSVWNMLDWDPTTCWAEGNSGSEGIGEGFAYRFSGQTRIDGFEIFPGYQKSQSVYRKNLLPSELYIEAGGYKYLVDLEPWIQDLPGDGYAYYADFVFSPPIYADTMYVMVTGVGTYGSNPDYDCCISEFHPFRF